MTKSNKGCCVVERRRLEDVVLDVGDGIRVRVLEVDRNRVKLAIIADRDIHIDREGGRGEPKPKE